MVEFEKIEGEIVEFGENEFIEVGRKKAVSDEGERAFVSLSRGFIADDGSRRYKSNFSIPADQDVLAFIVEHLPEMAEPE